MGKRVVELESTKARLKLLERNQHQLPIPNATNSSALAEAKSQRNLPSSSASAAGALKAAAESSKQQQQALNSRVQFDLKKDASSVKKVSNVSVVEGLRAANAVADSRLSSTGGRRGLLQQQLTGSALPSDTRQRLEEMATSGRKNLAAKTGASSTGKDPVQELIASRFAVNNNTAYTNKSGTGTASSSANHMASKPPIGRANSVHQQQQQQANNNRFRSNPALSTAAPTTATGQTALTANPRERSLNLKNSSSSDMAGGDQHQQQHSSSPNLSSGSNLGQQLSINDPSKKVRPKSFWASWWRF